MMTPVATCYDPCETPIMLIKKINRRLPYLPAKKKEPTK